MLNPGKISVVTGRNSILPSHIFSEKFALPITYIERRIRKDKVCLEIFVKILSETVCMMGTNVTFNAPYSKVHVAETPGGRVRLLAINGNIALSSAVGLHKFL